MSTQNPWEFPVGSFAASGPVILREGENGLEILLDREQKPEGVTPWMIPGGRVENILDTSTPDEEKLRATCVREVKEEVGVDIEILRALDTFFKVLDNPDGTKRIVVLVHYLARILGGELRAGEGVVEYGWFPVNNLPECTDNVREVLKKYFAEPKF